MEQLNAGYTTDEYATMQDCDSPYILFPNLPNYNDVMKYHLNAPALSIPPPRYEVIEVPRPSEESSITLLRYKRMHLIYGTLNVVLGGFQMAIDPILPAIMQYPYSMYPGGVFIVLSGLCSIYGSRKENKCSLVASLVFNILALPIIFANYVIGILASNTSQSNFIFCYQYNNICYPSISFYKDGIRGFGIFNIAYGIILFVLILWDSSLKCGDVCCIKRQKQNMAYNPNELRVESVGHI